DGALYYVGRNGDGTIYRLTYNGVAQNLIVYPTDLNMVEGGTGVFTVRLASPPDSDVTVNVARISGDGNIDVATGASLVFIPANYATPQLVTLSAAARSDFVNSAAIFLVSSGTLQSCNVAVNAI